MGGGSTVMKYLLFSYNFFFFLAGCSIIGLGIWLKVEDGDYGDISDYDFLTAANFLIGAGVIITVVAFLGCFGAIKEIAPMLLAFFILMLIIFILQVATGAYAYIERDDLEVKLSEEFRSAIKFKYSREDEDGLTKAIDKFQREFDCCGYDDFRDYMYSLYTNNTKSIPKSCCKVPEANQDCGKPDASLLEKGVYYKKGCFNEVKKFLKDNLLVIGGSGIGLAVPQIIGMVFALILYCRIRSEGSGTLA